MTCVPVDIGGVAIRLRRDGQNENVSGLIEAQPVRVRQILLRHWRSLFQDGFVECDYGRETLNLEDVITWAATVSRHRRAARRNVSTSLQTFMHIFMSELIGGLASCLDSFCAVHYHEGPPPSLRRTGGEARRYVKTSPESAWEMMEKARSSRANLGQAIQLGGDQENLGCHQSVGPLWMNKYLQIYYERCQLGFDARDIYHWNLVADPGHHSYRECLVSLLYSWETHAGCYPPWQYLLPGRHVTPLDCNLDESIEASAARMKCERVAAYRQLQGYGAQISWMTKGQLSLEDFDTPLITNVRPLREFERRVTTVDGGKNIDFLVDTRTNERLQVLPLELVRVRLLLLMLDQGGIGAAGVAFAAFKLRKLIWAKFDLIHRLVRDMKLAETHCMNQIFTKAKLWSAYLMSFNNRPFGSGANFPLKQRLLDLIRVTRRGIHNPDPWLSPSLPSVHETSHQPCWAAVRIFGPRPVCAIRLPKQSILQHSRSTRPKSQESLTICLWRQEKSSKLCSIWFFR